MRFRAMIPLLLPAALAACDSGSPAEPGPAPLPPLAAGAWFVHQADGQQLPALVAHGLVDGRLRQTYLDSARLSINAGGLWEQALYFQSWEDDTRVESFERFDHGSWLRTDTAYIFLSDLHGQRYVLKQPPQDSLALMLRADGIPGALGSVLRKQQPVTIAGAWRASHVRGMAMPNVLYRTDGDTVNGQPISYHLVVDSSRVIMHPDRYEHRVWVSEWHGVPGGPPQTLIIRWYHGDHGAWTRAGPNIAFTSHWLQGHTMTGSFGADGVLRMEHGFSHGDPPEAFRYAR